MNNVLIRFIMCLNDISPVTFSILSSQYSYSGFTYCEYVCQMHG